MDWAIAFVPVLPVGRAIIFLATHSIDFFRADVEAGDWWAFLVDI